MTTHRARPPKLPIYARWPCPQDWRWSSYRFYEMHDPSVLVMDWGGRGPIVW
ncbi:MAG: hypothetical protein IH899_14815 [Planctomycetes bacterium]|nr:hypothetical protein [Planctomycetota bacterium]